jgi:mannonate dehydratase
VDDIDLDIRRVCLEDPAMDLRDGVARPELFTSAREKVEAAGMRLGAIFVAGWDEIALGTDDCDEKIDAWCTMLEGIGAAGIPVLGYNFKPMGNFRTPSPVGRGGALYSTFDRAAFDRTPHKMHALVKDETEMFAHLERFLTRVIPVAEASGVKMALHPDDPPIAEPLGGLAQIASTLEQFRRIFAIVESPANGMLFCQGCITELGVDVYEAIAEFARNEWIVNVHFRNVRGALPTRFEEVFLDEGDVDMLRAMETYRDNGYDGPFMMDHSPKMPEGAPQDAGRAFATGYIRALIQTVYRS